MVSASLNFPTTPYPVSAVVTSCTRSDTGASVSASITGASANWVLSITEPAPNLLYNYVVTFSFSGGINSQAIGSVNGTVTTPAGYYTSYDALVAKFGYRNIVMWSNLTNDNVLPNYVNITTSLVTTDSQINQFWANGPYNVPLTPINFMIQNWATDMAAYFCYFCRGAFESDTEGQKLTTIFRQAMAGMAAYKGLTSVMSLGCQRRWPSPTSAVAARGFR